MVMNGATATEFLLPLILGISILTFLVTATIALSPTDTEIRAEDELMNRINAARAAAEAPAPYLTHASGRRPVTAISRAAQARRQADSGKGLRLPLRRRAQRRCAQQRLAARHRLSGSRPAISSGSSHQAGTAVLLSA